MPKKTVLPPIGQRQLSQQLRKNFPDVNSTIEKTSETFKERSEDIDELIKKLGETDKNADQVTFEFEFLTGGKYQKFDSFTKKYVLTNENMLFVDFLQTEYWKEILQSNDLKIHIETGNIYYQDLDTMNLYLNL